MLVEEVASLLLRTSGRHARRACAFEMSVRHPDRHASAQEPRVGPTYRVAPKAAHILRGRLVKLRSVGAQAEQRAERVAEAPGLELDIVRVHFRFW